MSLYADKGYTLVGLGLGNSLRELHKLAGKEFTKEKSDALITLLIKEVEASNKERYDKGYRHGYSEGYDDGIELA